MKQKILVWGAVIFNCSILLINIGGEGVIWFTLIVLLNIVTVVIIQTDTRRFHNELKLLAGKGQRENNLHSFIRQYFIDTNLFVEDTHRAISVIKDIGQDHFGSTILNINNENIRTSLLSANQKITDLRKKEMENSWITGQVAAISDLKQKGNDVSEYSYNVISMIVKTLSANQGGFFILKKEGGSSYLELTACYAYDRKKYIHKSIHVGDGIIGQVYYEKDIIYMTDVPKDYVKITSGLGEALPTTICIVPLLFEGDVYGAIEIASFHKLEEFQITYLRKVSEIIGYNLSAMEVNHRTELLLAESQKMAQEVKSQEEELRQNLLELTATQEIMFREKKKLETLSLVADHTNNSVLITDAIGNIVYTNTGFSRLTGYSPEEVMGKKPGALLQGPLTDAETVGRISAKIKAGEPLYEEILNYSKTGEIYWVSLVINPVRDADDKIQKFISIQANITETKKNSLDNLARLQSISRTNAVVEFGIDGKILDANDLFYKISGFSKERLAGRTIDCLIPQEDINKPQHLVMWQNILLGHAFSGEFRYIDSNNKIQWLSGTYNPIFDLSGRLERILMLGQFVTQDKEKVHDLQETIVAIKSCFPIVEINPDLSLKSANELFLELLGIKRLELRNKALKDVISNHSFAVLEHYLTDDEKQHEHIDLELLNKNDQVIRYNAKLIKFHGDINQPQRCLLILLNPFLK